ncbi:MAG: PEP-CTERM sorting domain-containing protein [Bryobacteraceae bacterium]|jgi:hypothetical protein
MKFGILALLAVSACSANTINFASSTSTPNSTEYATILATVDPSWATPLSSPLSSSWITTAGDTDPALGTSVTYTESFTLPAGFTNVLLNLGVYADDSATVMIDGTTLFTEDTTLGVNCASGPVGCTTANEGVITNMNVTADVNAGVNTITFQDFQEVGSTPFGVDFDGAISYHTSAVPEPNTILLLCAGLIVLASVQAILRRRAAKSVLSA